MDKRKILFVEDELEEDNEVWLTLHEQGYEVTPARVGQEAWDCLSKEKFDLILLDIMLPPDEGVGQVEPELAREKRTNMGLHILDRLRDGTFEPQGTPAHVPVIVVSAVPGVDRMKKLGEMVVEILVKPCSPKEVIAAIEDALS